MAIYVIPIRDSWTMAVLRALLIAFSY